MKSALATILAAIFCFASTARAAEDPAARALAIAATGDAVNNLLEEVSRTYLTRNLTVKDFLQQTHSNDEFAKTLARAQQIGGPRWVDNKTCQIELQISGPVISQSLQRIAAANPKDTPISANEISRATKNWDVRSFAGTGSATSAVPVKRPRVHIGLQKDPWADVTPAARDQAIAAAKTDAARRSLASVTPVTLTPKSTVGDVLAIKEVGQGMETWFTSLPVARVELRDDLQAEVELTTTPTETFTTLKTLAVKQKDVPLPPDDAAWNKCQSDFEKRMATPVGRGVAESDAVAGFAPRKPLALPRKAPAWAAKRIEATAQGTGEKTKLLSARAAESAAETKLRRLIDEITLTPDQSIAQAAKADPRIEQAVTRALTHAKISQADYQEDGSAKVTLYLNLENLWQELKDAQ